MVIEENSVAQNKNTSADTMNSPNMGTIVRSALLRALAEKRVIVGLSEAVKSLSKTPDESLFCFLAPPKKGDSATHMHEVLLQAFCLENDIYIIQVIIFFVLLVLIQIEFAQSSPSSTKIEKKTQLKHLINKISFFSLPSGWLLRETFSPCWLLHTRVLCTRPAHSSPRQTRGDPHQHWRHYHRFLWGVLGIAETANHQTSRKINQTRASFINWWNFLWKKHRLIWLCYKDDW